MQKHLTLVSLLLAPLAGCTACEEGTLEELRPVIVVTPSALAFGEVPSRVESKDVLTVRNEGTVPLNLTSITFEPDPTVFEMIEVPQDVIAPANSIVIQITVVAPSTTGPYRSELVIQSDDPVTPEVRIPLTIEAVPPPPCDDGNVCTADFFDPVDKECKNTFDDGVVCQPADRCVINATCRQGVCLGEPKVCDDNSPCTQDFCRQTDGECFFVEEISLCDDDNPCTFDTCAADTGCQHLDAPAGTPCDDGDECSLADSCFAGQCQGRGLEDGSPCDDGDSCTSGDLCLSGVCSGQSIIDPVPEGQVVFTYPLTDWPDAFLHRREVSMSQESGALYGLDHLRLGEQGLTHVVFSMNQCGSDVYEFAYRPPDSNVWVSRVRRGIQIGSNDRVRMYVGVRQTIDTGFQPQTTSYILEKDGTVVSSGIQTVGGETGRSLLPDGSNIYGIVDPITFGVPPPNSVQDLVVIREDSRGNVLWRHTRNSEDIWAEFLGVAGPRVLFWESGRFGALDFNTGALVWSQPTAFITKELALSTGLNLGVARASSQIIAVEILNGNQVFTYPPAPNQDYIPRTDPVISSDGRILVMMQRSRTSNGFFEPLGLSWVELDLQGTVLSETILPYAFPPEWQRTRHEDFNEDPYPTVADDGVSYVGFGDTFWAIDPGGSIRWTLTSTVENAFTGTVPLLRDDGILMISNSSRTMLGVKTNGGKMAEAGWASFRHDGARTNFTP